MPKPKIMLILSENWTLVDGQDLNTLVDWAAAAEMAGIDGVMLSEHVSLGPAAGAKGREANDRAYMAPGNQDPETPWPERQAARTRQPYLGGTRQLRTSEGPEIHVL